MHSVAQMQLHGIHFTKWVDDLTQAHLCLETLKFCGTIDQIAMQFYTRLLGIFNNLVKFIPKEAQNVLRHTQDWVSLPPDFPPIDPDGHEEHRLPDLTSPDTLYTDYLLTIPENTDPQLASISVSLLFAMCRPWGDPSEGNGDSTECTAAPQHGWRRDAIRIENSQLLERLSWRFTRRSPFQWDTSSFGMRLPGPSPRSSMFLDSEQPSGWLPAADVYEDGFCDIGCV